MQPRMPMGSVPDKLFEDTGDTSYYSTKVGIITRVDEISMKCDVKLITGSRQYFELDMTQAMCGPRSFLGGIPELNSLVTVGFRRKHKNLWEAVILNYIPIGHTSGLRFDPFSSIDPSQVDPEDQDDADEFFGPTIRYKRILGKPGDIMGMSSGGAEFGLSRDAKLFNRAGDLFELRDVDRTLLTQAIHQVHSDAGTYTFSGPIRRGAMNLPLDIFQKDKAGLPTRIVKDSSARFFGRDELAVLGPAISPFIDASGKILPRINEEMGNDNPEFPPVTYSNGRQVFYPSSIPASNFESLGGSGRAYVERRMEMRHDSDLRQPVLEEIDGFFSDPYRSFITQVFGTVVGNDPYSTQGQRQYGRVLKPKIFHDFDAPDAGPFLLEEANRVAPDEADTMAAAYHLQINPPKGVKDFPFNVAVSKQGKLFASIPGSIHENYGSKNISAELNFEGALKARFGASKPENVSAHITFEGGIVVDIGADATGNSITTNYKGAVANSYKGNNDNDVAYSHEVQGNSEASIEGSHSESVNGTFSRKVSGGYQVQASRVNMNALNGYTGNFGEYNLLTSGKSQFNYAQQVLENIALGGRISTILAGAEVKNIVAGGMTTNITAGAVAFNSAAGAFAINVGTGALGLTTGAGAVTLSTGAGAIAISAGGGAIAITSGLAVNITGTIVALIAPQILLGGPPAVLGVVRGAPALPPGVPSLDFILGIPYLGSAVVRSL